MGLRIYCIDENQPVPRDTVLELTCDGDDHGLFKLKEEFITYQRFSGANYAVQYRAAMAAGWKDTFAGSRRVMLGPCCSGKRPETSK